MERDAKASGMEWSGNEGTATVSTGQDWCGDERSGMERAERPVGFGQVRCVRQRSGQPMTGMVRFAEICSGMARTAVHSSMDRSPPRLISAAV